MDAVLRVNGIKTNFYKKPLDTYKRYCDWLESDSLNDEKFKIIKKRFKIYGVLLIIGLLMYPLIGLIFHLTRK